MADALERDSVLGGRECLPDPPSGKRNRTGIVSVSFDAEVPGGEIWDLVCGLSDQFPIQEDWVRSLVSEFAKYLKEEPWRVLDLGAGSGNPAIGLASLGHRVVAVDSDPWMLATCARRADLASVNLPVAHRDWRGMSPADLRDLGDGGPFDLILCLGNSLGYQDSWPDQEPGDPLTAARLADTFQKWTDALAPGGVIALEVAVEDASELPYQYVRFPSPPPRDNRPAVNSCWIVSIREDLSREVDTIVYEDGANDCHRVVGRITYRGHTITNDVIREASRRVGMAPAALVIQRRPYFSTYLLRRATP